MPNKMTMNRQGVFNVKTFGPNHCGTTKDLDIKYHMVCECEPVLDGRGFLFDQVNVDLYFQEIKRTSLSCERLTVRSLEALVVKIRQENPHCRIRRVDLTLSPAPYGASMTYSWKPEKASKSGKAVKR